MGYEDDQCEQCGGIRVEGSNLCEDCLVQSVNSLRPALQIAEAKIEDLNERFDRAIELVDKLLSHISSEAMYTSELQRAIRELMDDVHGPAGENG